LPNYQLERRADVLFSLYLPEVVSVKVGKDVFPIMIPELPIHCGLIDEARVDMKSIKADYLLMANDRTEAYLLELKTDDRSRRPKQDKAMVEICRPGKGLSCVLESAKQIAAASSRPEKYAEMFRVLSEMQLVTIPSGASANRMWFERVEVLPCPKKLRVIYVKPTNEFDEPDIIDFAEMRQCVQRYDDELSVEFAERLKVWAANPV
jgi:hypothetical protein